jgi:hypothetical protein
VYSALCLAFDGANLARWDPATMALGHSLADQLRKAITDCEVCVLIATRSSIESPWCLAEVGAFWGSGKTVIIYLADPDLTESVLPPQLKGNLMARNARDLIASSRSTVENRTTVGTATHQMQFFASSGDFGGDSEWLKLLNDTNEGFDIMGVSLLSWRQTQGFREAVSKKAKHGCKVRILLMHQDNTALTASL